MLFEEFEKRVIDVLERSSFQKKGDSHYSHLMQVPGRTFQVNINGQSQTHQEKGEELEFQVEWNSASVDQNPAFQVRFEVLKDFKSVSEYEEILYCIDEDFTRFIEICSQIFR